MIAVKIVMATLLSLITVVGIIYGYLHLLKDVENLLQERKNKRGD